MTSDDVDPGRRGALVSNSAPPADRSIREREGPNLSLIDFSQSISCTISRSCARRLRSLADGESQTGFSAGGAATSRASEDMSVSELHHGRATKVPRGARAKVHELPR